MRPRAESSSVILILLTLGLAAGCGDNGARPDTIPPAAVTDLSAAPTGTTSVVLAWTAPGDDGETGTASQYGVRYSTSPDTTASWWNAASSVSAPPIPAAARQFESFVVQGLESDLTYYFALKAADEAGNWSGRSNVAAAKTGSLSFPLLAVSSSAFGSRQWSGWSQDIEEYEVPQGGVYELTLSGDASWYGGTITGYAFGWDLEDIYTQGIDPDGIRAWTPWSTTRTTVTAEFTDPRDYSLYIKCKDNEGGVTLGIIHFVVVPFGATKNLGFIDDWRAQFLCPGQDAEEIDDETWRKMLEGYDYGQGWDDLVWDEWEAPYGEEMPGLEFLMQFKVIVWSINDIRTISPVDKSAWYWMNYLHTTNVLAVYLGSEVDGCEKGKLWAFGRAMVESCVLPYGSENPRPPCEYPYPVNTEASPTGCYIRPNSFAYDYLHIRGDWSSSEPDSGGARVHYFMNTDDRLDHLYVNSDPLPIEGYITPPAAVLYPSLPHRLELDTSKCKYYTLTNFEVLEYPRPNSPKQILFYDPELQAETNLIPLYRYWATSETSQAHQKFCGFRYIPTGIGDHGEIVYFFFPTYIIKEDQARATAKVVLTDWFGLPDPDVYGSGR